MTFPTRACACAECVSMCERRPCWPTPEEAQKIIDAGHGGRLMRDYWIEREGQTDMLAPAIVGREGSTAPWWPSGRCTFLTAEGRCELHDLGLKPLEGRVAWHGMSDRTSERVRAHIVKLWRKNQHIVRGWQ